MKVVTLKDIPIVPAEGAAERIEGWTGPVARTRQTIIEPGDSKNYNCSVVNFSQGCTTGWHVHDCDQVLIVTSGSGMVATEHEQHEINVGDVAHVKAGERHWHGAKADTTMGHITITLVGQQGGFGADQANSLTRRGAAVNPALVTRVSTHGGAFPGLYGGRGGILPFCRRGYCRRSRRWRAARSA